MTVSNNIKETPKYVKISMGFLFIVILLTSAIYAYNFVIKGQNADSKLKLETINTSIEELRNEETIQAYELYKVNRNKLESLSRLSNIPLFLVTIKKFTKEYGISLNNFSYSKGLISVSSSSESRNNTMAFEKYNKFISDFRKEDGKKKDSILDLNFVNSFAGHDLIKSNFTFTIDEEQLK